MMLRCAALLTASLVLMSFVDLTHEFTMGAPDSACARMEPGHGFSPQTGPPPVKLVLDKTAVNAGEEVKVTLQSADGQPFKGFLIQARDSKVKDDKDSQVGNFVSEGASYMTCFSGIHNSITHHDSDAKTKVEASWKAPADFEGDVTFRYSFVQEYDRYWVRIDADTVRVTRSASAAGPTGQSASPGNKAAAPETTTVDSRVEFPGGAASDTNTILTTTTAQSTTQVTSTTAKSTTTTSVAAPTTTTTTQASVTEAEHLHTLSANHSIFAGCGDTKACFGLNDNNENCIGADHGHSSCIAVVSYELSGEKWLFKMAGKVSGYLAVGLSFDDRMGDDLTAACFVSNGEVGTQAGYNVGKSNMPLTPAKFAIEDFSGKYEDGFLSCEFKRPLVIKLENHGGKTFHLEKDEYVILLAEGDFSNGLLQYHTRKIKSAEPRALGIAKNLAGASRLFIQLHGSFMIAAWIFSASCGILLARYFKQTWTGAKCCKLDQWFIWHRLFMIITWMLTVAGFVLIFLELNGWTEIPINKNPHAVLGCITTGLCFMQPFLALLRCAPGHRRRPIFNWIHWFCGNAAQIVAIVAIFFAVELDKAGLPRVTDYLLIAFVAFHFLMHLILSLHQCSSDMRRDKNAYSAYPMRSLNGHKGVYPDYEELKRDSPGAAVRKFFLAVYLLVSGVAAAALILLVIYGNFENVITNV